MTAYLLDTHAFLWWIRGDNNIPKTAGAIIADPSLDIYVSHASIWEIAIKISIGKLTDPGDTSTLIRRAAFTSLEITLSHIERIKALPFHHRDPFDRMLIAQSLAQDITLISNETVFDQYGAKRIWD